MLDLALSLVDRVISLVKRREEVDRKLHDDFFVPIVADFETLHRNYLDTFAAYRTDLESTTTSLSLTHPVLAKINRDSLFSGQIRSKLQALREYKDDPVFSEVVLAVLAYISTGEMGKTVLLDGRRPIPNAPRQRLWTGLKEIFAGDLPDSSKVTEAVTLLDQVVGELQIAYRQFVAAADRTKRRLLDRRIKK